MKARKISTNQAVTGQHINTSSESPTRLRGRWSIWARAIYLILFILFLYLFIAGIPTQFEAHSSCAIGIYLRRNSAGEIVISPAPSMLAAEAGVQEGDVLIAVDGISLQPEMGNLELFRLLRGPAGAQVLLDVRGLEGSTRQYSIIRSGFPLEEFGISTNAYALYLTSLGVALVLASCIPAVIIVLRKPEDWLAIFMSTTLLVIAINTSAAYAGPLFLPSPLSVVISFAYNFFVLLILYIFPDGRFTPRWTSRFVIVGVFWILWKVLPISIGAEFWASRSWIVMDLLIFGTGIYTQIYRYRNVSGFQERQQTKWITYGMAVAFLAQFAYYLLPSFIPAINARTELGLGFSLVGTTIHHLAILVLPITVTHAVLRRRLYEIDVIINRTVIYVLLSGIVAGAFAATITLSQRVFVALTGQRSDVAYVLTTLVVVAIVTPAKDYLQA